MWQRDYTTYVTVTRTTTRNNVISNRDFGSCLIRINHHKDKRHFPGKYIRPEDQAVVEWSWHMISIAAYHKLTNHIRPFPISHITLNSKQQCKGVLVISIATMQRIVGSTLSLVGSERRNIVAATNCPNVSMPAIHCRR